MSKRARYNGPFVDGVIVDDPYSGHREHVKKGGLLSDDAPASLRDELLKNQDDWSEVSQPSSSDSKKGD